MRTVPGFRWRRPTRCAFLAVASWSGSRASRTHADVSWAIICCEFNLLSFLVCIEIIMVVAPAILRRYEIRENDRDSKEEAGEAEKDDNGNCYAIAKKLAHLLSHNFAVID